MNDTDPSSTPWLNAWLESQHDWLKRWQAAVTMPRTDGMHLGMDAETLRNYFAADGATAAMHTVQSFQTLLQSSMAQFAAQPGDHAADSTGAAWQHTWQQLSQAFAMGPAREHQQAWREFTQALADYQARQQAVLHSYSQVFAQSLEAVRIKVEQQQAQDHLRAGLRELHELWIDCGEQAFAQLAHDESFIAAQAASVNARSRLQRAHNVLIEKWFKAHDLPTRSELNSVHLRLRQLTTRVAELERRLADSAPSKPATAKPRKPARKV